MLRLAASFLIGLGAGIATSIGLGKAPGDPVQEEDGGEPEDSAASYNRVLVGLAYGFGELLGGIARPLAIGTVLGGAIGYFLPPGVLERYVGQGMLSYLVMLAVGIPLYVCASGSIPLAAALMAKGISPGAALGFLLAGPATNAATVTVVSGMLGRRALVIYLTMLTSGAFATGIVTDAFFGWFPSLLPDMAASGIHGSEGLSWFELACGALLGVLTAWHLAKQLKAKLGAGKKKIVDGALVLKVPDMTCQHCARTITGAVCDLPGVRGVQADSTTKLVSLDLDGEADAGEAVRAIENAGFHPEIRR